MRKHRFLLFAFPLISLAFCGLSAGKNAISVSAASEGESTSLYDEAPAEEKPVTENTVTKWIDEKLVPIVGGFSVANLIGIVVAVVTAAIKSKGDKAIKTAVAAVKDAADAATASTASFDNRLTEFKEQTQSKLNDMCAVYENARAELEETKGRIDEFARVAVEQNVNIEKVTAMRDALVAACNLIAQSLAMSEEAVRSGIADEALALVESLQGGNPDGEGS